MKTTNQKSVNQISRRSLLKYGVSLAAAYAVLPLLSGCSSTSKASANHIAMINSMLQKHRLPGASIAVIENGYVSWHQGFGVTNVSTQIPVNEKTLFQAASLTKPLFAYVVLQAVDKQELHLDDKLTDYVIPEDLSDNPWNYQITVRDVLQHTSGLPNWRADKNGPEKLEAKFEPGTDTSYSGEAYHWLQKVMETITGSGLDVLVRERLLVPAGLEDMSLLWTPQRDEREVYSHKFNDEDILVTSELQYIREHGSLLNEVAIRWGLPMQQWTTKDHARAVKEMSEHTHPRLKKYSRWFWNRPGMSTIDCASSLRCTAGDYARFMCLMMQSENGRNWKINEQTKELMLSPQHETGSEVDDLRRGFGWSLEMRPNGIAYYHWGSNGPSHKSLAFADASRKKGVVIMTNGPTGNDFIKDVATVLLNENYTGILS
ncbi:serine hydrolase domain-containing protein [Pseudoalteromonas sp. H105]|uniref:serine hydrolase domain-containing protein n=1 Tax=Pseudoalteromonas sp. H105 TaxID=1348393 RepID=UPI00073228E1|nr:serine hydrolase domain-containing protein [Pseudoalteromonas sp. H105]KTF13704.1 hypothetical protein ATS75_14120 [Pseudoalteromonas sp. H105]